MIHNKRGLSYAVLIQLLILLLVIGTIYAASTRVGDKETFISEAYAVNSALISEAMLARSQGRITLTTAYDADRETQLEDGRVRVGSSDVALEDGIIKYFYQPADARAIRSTTASRLQTYLRSENVITLNPARLTADNCPEITEQANWETIYVNSEFRASIIDGVHQGIGMSPLPTSQDDPARAELDIYLNMAAPAGISGPESGKNRRLGCLLKSEMLLQFNQRINYTSTVDDEIRVNLTQDLSQEQIRSLFQAATGRMNN